MENIRMTMKNSNLNLERQDSGADFEVIDRCLVIRLSKELDHHSAITLREKSDKLIDKGNVKNIIFDFKDSNFMDSSGIGVIMGRYKKVIFTGGKVAVTNVNDSVNRIFNLSGLYKIIEKHSTIAEALKTL